MQYRLLIAAALIAAGCHDAGDAATEPALPSARLHLHPAPPATKSPLPVDQLLSVKRATARYHDIEQARRDNYIDLGVVIPNMGRHFLREGLLDATFDLIPIETSLILADEERCRDLDDMMSRMGEGDDRYRYSVAWIDCGGHRRGLGRGILGRGDHAPLEALPKRAREHARRFKPMPLAVLPDVLPSGLVIHSK